MPVCKKKMKRRKKVFTKVKNGKKVRFYLTAKGKGYLKGNKKAPHLK